MVIKLGDDGYKRFLNDQTEHDGTLIDPAYKIFLEHLRKDGKSYVFEMINENHGLPTFVKYESEDGFSEESKLDTRITSGNISLEERGNCVTKRWRSRRTCSKLDRVAGLVPDSQTECCLVDESYQKFLSLLKIEGRSMSLEYEPGVSITYEEEKGTGASVTQEEIKETSAGSESLATENIRRSCSKTDQVASFSYVPNSHSECSLVDDSYQKFLSLLKIDGSSMSLEYEPGVSVKYEEEKGTGASITHEEVKETSTGSESLAPESNRSCSKSDQVAGLSFVPNKHSECSLVDESYQKFLSLLKIEGSSMSLEYEPGVSVKYEEEKGTGTSVTHEEVKETSTGSESLAPDSTRSCSKSDKAAGLSSVPNKHSECSLVDESYQKFLSLLKIEGNSMSLEYEPGVSVKYEEEKGTGASVTHEEVKETSTGSESLTPESTRSCSKSDQVAGLSFVPNKHSECSLVDDSYQIFLSLLKIEGSSMSLEYEPGVSVKYEEEKGTGASVTHEEVKETSTGSESLAPESTRSCSMSDQVAGLSFVPNKHSECSLVDESYQKFLTLLKIEGSSMSLEYEPGVSVTYEEEKEISTASESLVTESTVYSNEQKLLPYISTQPADLTAYEDDKSSMLSLGCCNSSDFGKKLLVILNKPYDQNEYEELLNEATYHKPLIREKQLRSMSKSYATNKKGLSYLDYYPDLAEQLESADCYKRLMLLRGFFFWLENLCHEGAFRPWVSSHTNYEINANSDCELVLPH